VTVNAVSAGLIRTAEIERWFYLEAKARGWGDDWNDIETHIRESYLPIPVGHIGKPEDVARAVAFLASPDSAYINGAILRVDGGSHTWAG
jgi:NAD(P)-dependent dehydrogenase (short-subunit alcohol dehydrogenase family)